MSDNVNKPSHYAFSEIECIDYLKAIVPLRSFIDHCRMSAIAYITRSPHKGSEVEDIDKAISYLQRARNEAEKAIRAAESEKPSEPEPLAIPEGWRELEENEPLSENDLFEFDGEWVGHECDPSGGVYSSRIHCRHIRKIETLEPERLAVPEGWRELEPDDVPKVNDMLEWMGCWQLRTVDSSQSYKLHDRKHIRKIETENPSEAPNSSIPHPGEGYRLLSKDPPERVVKGDEFWCDTYWEESDNWRSAGRVQCSAYYRRKIEAAQ